MEYAVVLKRTFVGLDVHKRTIQGALLLPDGEYVEQKFVNTASGRRKLARWIGARSEGQTSCCYEAGPTGYLLQREFIAAGLECAVIAPSLTPQKPGDKRKTDRRDAKKLAELHRAGLLTEVRPPTPAQEALRDLTRCREDCRRTAHQAGQQLQKFLDRRGIVSPETPGTQRHRTWLAALKMEDPISQAVLNDYRSALEHQRDRLRELDLAIEAASQEEPHRAAVGALRCFRGIDTLTATVLVAELYSFGRFTDPRKLMAFVGLTPSEESSGETELRGGITKTGNRHVRRMLIEASWNYQRRPSVGVKLAKRREGQPREVVVLADRAMARLNRRYHRLVARGKRTTTAVTAVARELVGFLWAALQLAPTAA